MCILFSFRNGIVFSFCKWLQTESGVSICSTNIITVTKYKYFTIALWRVGFWNYFCRLWRLKDNCSKKKFHIILDKKIEPFRKSIRIFYNNQLWKEKWISLMKRINLFQIPVNLFFMDHLDKVSHNSSFVFRNTKNLKLSIGCKFIQ